MKVPVLVNRYEMQSHIPTIDVRDIDERGYQKKIIIGADLHDAVTAYLGESSEHLKKRFEELPTNEEYWETADKARQEILTQDAIAISKTSSSYVLDNRPQILDYLREHRSLFRVLADGSLNVRRIFGHVRKPHLELFRDPEEGWETLIIKVQSPYAVKKNIGLVHRYRHEWLFNLEFEDYNLVSALVEPYVDRKDRK